MERDLAKLVAITAFESAAGLNNLIPLLKQRCDEREYRELSLAIATSSAEISLQIINKMFAIYPDMKTEFDAHVQKFGRPF